MVAKRQFVRFAVGEPDGPRSAVWRLWIHNHPDKSDIFVSPRNVAGVIKASLHQSGRWRFAFTSEYAKREFDHLEDPLGNRLVHQWTRPDVISPGVTLAFRVIIPGSELISVRGAPEDPKDTIWLRPPNKTELVEIDFILTAPNTQIELWPGRDSMGNELLWKTVLPSGEVLWLVYMYGTISARWMEDKKAFQKRLLETRPKFIHGLKLWRAQALRILIMGIQEDQSRYFMDLAAANFIDRPYVLKAMCWSIQKWMTKTLNRPDSARDTQLQPGTIGKAPYRTGTLFIARRQHRPSTIVEV